MNACSAVRLTLYAVAPIVLSPTPAWSALYEREPPPESQPDAAQHPGGKTAHSETRNTQSGEFDLEAYLAKLKPPTVEKIIVSLEPVPTLEECLAPLPDDPDAPWRRALTGDDKSRVEAMEKQIRELREQGQYAEAIELAEDVLAIRREHQSGCTNADGAPAECYEVGDARRAVEDLRRFATLTPEQRAELAVADGADTKVEALNAQRRYSDALQVSQEQLRIRRRLLDDDHPATLDSINSLGWFLKGLGRLQEAEVLLCAVVNTSCRVLGEEHPATLISIINLAGLLRDCGDVDEAESLARKAVGVSRRALGKEHPDTLYAINTLALALLAQGRLEEAEPLLREDAEATRRVLGEDHPEALTSSNDLAALLHARGSLEEAESLFRSVLEARRRTFGEGHPATLQSINNLANLLSDRGRLEEAELLLRTVVEGFRGVAGEEHPHTLTSVSNLGALLYREGKLAEAEPYLREVLEARRRALGEEHPSTLTSMNILASVLEAHGRLDEAGPYFRAVLEDRRRALGADHPSTLISANNMGFLLQSQGRLAEAELLYDNTLEAYRRTLGEDHPSTLTSIGNMGSLLKAQGRLTEAEPYCRKAVDGFRRVLGNDHPDTLTSITHLGVLLESLGRLAVAESYYREALHIAERLRTQIAGAESSRAGYAGKIGLAGIAARLSSLLLKANRTAEAWGVSERGRGRAVLDLLARNDQDLVELARARAERLGDAGALDALEGALGKEQQARVELTTAEALLMGTQKQHKHTESRDDLSNDEKAARLAKLDRQIADQEQAVKSKRRMLAGAGAEVLIELRGLFPDAKPMPIEQIRAGLERGELALSYTWTDEFVTLLTAPAAGYGEVQGLALADGKAEAQELTELVREARSSLVERPMNALAAGNAIAVDGLSTRLLPKAIRKHVQAADRLIILPDGPLHDIPFDILALGEGKPRELVVESDTQTVYAGSATMYLNRRAAALRKSSTGPPSAVVLGDPVFHREPLPEPDYPNEGVLLAMVASDSNAAKAGLSRGDVLLSYDGKKLPDPEALAPAIAAVNQAIESGERKADEPVKLTFWRDGKTHDTSLSPGRMGVRPSRGNPADGLRSMAQTSRSIEQRGAEVSATDQVRLYGGKLSPLPGTAREAKSITGLFQRARKSLTKAGTGTDPEDSKNKGSVVLLSGEDATIGKLGESVRGKRFVHLATHGLMGSSARPYDASLALTQPKMATPEDIGFLRLSDLIRTWRGKLADCDLVVLSACDTQRGVQRGTSVMTLPVGFMYAGAPTVVASLWKVDDTATTLLMIRFYENLLGRFAESRIVAGQIFSPGRPMLKIEALQEAKQWLRGLTIEQVRRICAAHDLPLPSTLARGEPGPMKPVETPEHPFEHPYYWSAFILSGDPG